MKKSLFFVVALVVVALLAGCTTVVPVSSPELVSPLAEKDYEIVGRLAVEGSYQDLLREVEALGADDVINIYEENETMTAGMFVLSAETTFYGIAIKYID